VRIVTNEMRKMWNIKILAIIAVLCAAYFLTSMNSWIENYPRGTWFSSVDIAHHLTENYGTTLEYEDFRDFLNHRKVVIAELDQFVQSNAFFAGLGLYSFDALSDLRSELGLRYDTLNSEELRLLWDIGLELGYIVRTQQYGDLTSENETPSAYLELRSFETAVAWYQRNILRDDYWPPVIDRSMAEDNLTSREYQRLAEIRNSGELLSIIVYATIFHTWQYAQSLAVLVVLVTLILVSPLVTADKANRVNRLQYSSKQGRGILKKQFAAVVISATIMTTILLAIFGTIFVIRTDVQAFWNNGINSFLSHTFHWLSITYGQWVLLMAGIVYILSVGVAIFAFILSRFSQNMIRLMFKVIPFFVAAQVFAGWMLVNFLDILQGGNVILKISSLVFLLVVGGLMVAVVLRKERKVELV